MDCEIEGKHKTTMRRGTAGSGEIKKGGVGGARPSKRSLLMVSNLRDALRAGAMHDCLSARRETFDRLSAHDPWCMGAMPQQLAAGLVNRYLEIKRSGRL